MNDIRKLLRKSDPLAHEAGLAMDEVQRMRRTVIGAASVGDGAKASTLFWPRPVFVTLTIAATIAVAVVIGRRLPAPQAGSSIRSAVQNSDVASPSGERRQLQFATPGGTRIIWVFDPDFSL